MMILTLTSKVTTISGRSRRIRFILFPPGEMPAGPFPVGVSIFRMKCELSVHRGAAHRQAWPEIRIGLLSQSNLPDRWVERSG
jgi:hypothetical protein